MESPPPASLVYGYKTIPVRPGTAQGQDGGFDCHTGELTYDATLKGDRLVETVLHEASHMILYEGAADLNEPLEEQVVTLIGNGFTQLFKRNPELLVWILRQLG